MPNTQEMIRTKIIQQIMEQVQAKVAPEKAALLASFIPKYYQNIPLSDFTERSLDDLVGAALSQWQLLEVRKPLECKLRVYNPQLEQDGWQSTHTIVELSYDDMPFLVDSMRMELNQLGMTTHLLINRGGVKIKRDDEGKILAILSDSDPVGHGVAAEAIIHMEIDRQTDPLVLESIQINLLRVLQDVKDAVEDWGKIREQIFKAIEELEQTKAPLDREELEETKAFLHWLANDHFTFLGFRDYEILGEGENAALHLIPHTGLGVLRDETGSKATRYFSELPPEIRKLILSQQILIITKTNTKSTVHRPSYTDYIGVKSFDENGKVIGERRFIGLYTSEAYTSNPKHIPFLRLKVETVLQKSGLPRLGHGAKALRNILETLPRDDLFQATTDELYDLAMGILQLQERSRIRLFIRKDAYNRYYSCFVYVPRDGFNTELLSQMKDVLMRELHGTEVYFNTHFSESILALVHFVIRIDPKNPSAYDVKEIEKKLVEVGRSWKADLREELLHHFGEEKGNELTNRYFHAFPAGYREMFPPGAAIFDIEHIEKLNLQHDLEMSFYRPKDAHQNTLRFKLFHAHTTIPLSDALPMLENMGLRVIGEQPYQITFKEGSCCWINDFNMLYSQNVALNVEDNKEIFQEAFRKIWRGEAENDGFNRLVLRAHLTWQETALLRAYAKYLRQTGFTFSQQYIEEALVNNPIIAGLLVQLFKMRFDPVIQTADENTLLSFEEEITRQLDEVINLDQDRILRRYLEVIRATLRTNYFQLDAEGHPKTYLSFKLDPKQISEMPLPLPMFEFFVYSPRFEGVHLRAAKVARGGIRWSDRREDFRTEILGLMKAQQVKNAVIVPAGAKGGFVLKCLASDATREAIMEEGIACYKNYIRGMLDLTDNLQGSEVIHPKNTVFYDQDDTYLVVAADKGTATFSDIANSISKEYGYWLDDAFASGGSTGYDHKKMAITSRGAWESVKQHFQELAIDIQSHAFTVVGIGDMSGDVFGNGMLLSEQIKLVAAFNHTHIFLDPHPDPKKSFEERKRLFHLPRSSWEDYNHELISPGGGVFRRSLKSISLSKEIQTVLGVEKAHVDSATLINLILKAPVDLIWNGGIGTYVKASYENNSEVGDRANDAIRVNGNELRCKVVGEGGNLGCTQLGRIEYDLQGGKINTDFIDNSGGVDCSDHEVNIKILLTEVIHKGLLTREYRDKFLIEMKNQVADLVLHNNYRQVRAISLAAIQSLDYLPLYMGFIDEQERAGKINRQLEYLPSNKTLLERKVAGKGLTRPEIAVLLAYSKIILKQEILNSDLVKDPYLASYIELAFPRMLTEKFPEEIRQHRLRPEIIATQLSNAVVTDMGITFVYQMHDETSLPVPFIVSAYVIMQEVFNLESFWREIDSLDYKVNPSLQLEMMQGVVRLVRRGVRWFLRNNRTATSIDFPKMIDQFKNHIASIYKTLPDLLVGSEKEKFMEKTHALVVEKVPYSIATHIAGTRYIYSALNIIQAAVKNQADINEVAQIYFALADRLDLVWFREKINTYPINNHWSMLARATFKDDLDHLQRTLTISVLKHKSRAKDITARVNAWFDEHILLVERWKNVLAELHGAGVTEAAMLSVAIRELLDVADLSAEAAA